MDRITNAICHQIAPFLHKKHNSRIVVNFERSEKNKHYTKKKLLYSTNDVLNNLQYKDETWNHIKYLGDIMWNDLFKWNYLKKKNAKHLVDNDCENTKVIFGVRNIRCKSSGKKNDWIFLKFIQLLKEPYMIEFDAMILSESTEFQFAFNFTNLGERYRFNLINNKVLNFDVVSQGFFHNNIISEPFSLQLNRVYNFKIVVDNFSFQYIVDENIVLSVNQKNRLINTGEFALILWDSNTSNIDALYENIQIFKI